ncbi:hypothetical protein SAMN06265795_102214 [Noviherbaspirillum humi]|uniref:Uncharacterized protein n=2 Tax=Noviherbaspirillum humi TaxID=1688639 RepID=A0A239DKD9_9BURK|nr:hypothetical protein SAMN06265795_102214 [Noviherbaspirillum humi]
MVTKAFALLATFSAWLAFLWLGPSMDFTRHAPTSIIALHLLPPLFACAAWMGCSVFVRRRRMERERTAALEAETRERARQRAEQVEADKRRAERERSIDCRAVSISGLGTAKAIDAFPASRDNCRVEWELTSAGPHADGADRIGRLSLLMRQALEGITHIEPDCLMLPMFIVTPTGVSDAHAKSLLKQAIATMPAQTGLKRDDQPAIFTLDRSMSDGLATLFDTLPELGAALLIAVDASDSDSSDLLDEESTLSPDRMPPAQGASALLLMSPAIKHVSDIEVESGTHGKSVDALLPYWEHVSSDSHASTTTANLAEWRRLAQLPVLARIHRAACDDVETGSPGLLTQTRRTTTLMNEALLNAGVGSGMAFLGLVHDAGNIAHCGKRLACLGSALHAAEIDFEPVGPDALNLTDLIGDLGTASEVALLACAVAKTVETGRATLSAAFLPHGRLALRFIMPSSDDGTGP